jgi:hypothetical protein
MNAKTSTAETEIVPVWQPPTWQELASKPAGQADWTEAEWFREWLILAHR